MNEGIQRGLKLTVSGRNKDTSCRDYVGILFLSSVLTTSKHI